MTPADPKKVALLLVAAVGACGYLLFSVLGIGKAGGPLGRPAGEESGESKHAALTGLQLTGDPFTHPILLHNKESAEAAIKASKQQPTHAEDPGSIPIFRPWAAPGALPGNLLPNGSGTHLEEVKPVENAGNSRPKIEESRTEIRLTAVMSVDRPMALLSVGGKESRAYREGDVVAPGWRVALIEDGGIVLGGKLGAHRLFVGGEVKL